MRLWRLMKTVSVGAMQTGFLAQLGRDVRGAVRFMVASPGFATAVVLSFAVGIAVHTLGYSIIDSLWAVRLPYPDSGRLVDIQSKYSSRDGGPIRGGALYEDFRNWAQLARSFDALGAYEVARVPVRKAQDARYLTVERASVSFFDVLRTKPRLGRLFRVEECLPGRDDVAVLSHNTWLAQFGARPDVLGSRMWVEGRVVTVIGVMPAGFRAGAAELAPSLWLPLTSTSESVSVIGRLRRGVGLSAAQAEMTSIGSRSSKVEIEIREMAAGLRARLSMSELAALPLGLELIFASACVNVAGLLLARGTRRFKEISLRAVLGASRARIVQQLLTENLLMASLGCAAGVALSTIWLRWLQATVPPTTQLLLAGNVNWRVLAVSALVTVVAAVVTGLGPALAVSQVNLSTYLGGGHSTPSRRPRLFSRLLIGTEVALTLLLLSAPGVMMSLWWYWGRVHYRVPADELLIMNIARWGPAKRSPEQHTAFFRDLLVSVRGTSGIRSAALADSVSVTPPSALLSVERNDSKLELRAGHRIVSPGYMETMAIPLLAGRFFTGQDDTSTERVAVVNETLGRRIAGTMSPVGASVSVNGAKRMVVGVVADMASAPSGRPPSPEVLTLYLQESPPRRMEVLVRTFGHASALGQTVTRSVRLLDPDQPVERVRSLRQMLDEDNATTRNAFGLVGSLALGALLLSGLGLHGIVAYSVSERTQEIGIRRALGGTKAKVVATVLRDGIFTAGAGLLPGLVMSVLASGALLMQIGCPRQLAWRFALQMGAGAATAILLVSLWAFYAPARRAAATEPMNALRCE